MSLRKFGISACPDDFSLSELIDISTGDERVLEPHEIPYNLQQSSHGPLKLYIRKREVYIILYNTHTHIHTIMMLFVLDTNLS